MMITKTPFHCINILWRSKSLFYIFSTFGFLWFVVECVSFFSPAFAEGIKPLWWLLVIVGVLIGIIKYYSYQKINCMIKGSPILIEIKVGDLFRSRGSIIVGCSTTFDTRMDDGTINCRSIQGKFTKKIGGDISLIDMEIANSLQGRESILLTEDEKSYGKKRKYPIGTVATVKYGNFSAYFLAITNLNEHHVAKGTFRDIQNALPMLWEYIANRGSFEQINIPIIGAGFSRIPEPREKIIKEILKSFVAACSSGLKFCEKLTVVVSPQDVFEKKVDLEELRKYLDYVCNYMASFSSPDSEPVGSAIN